MGSSKACKDFKPFVTNKDICDHWIRVAAVEDGAGGTAIFPCVEHCRKGLECPTLGQRPERLIKNRIQRNDRQDLS